MAEANNSTRPGVENGSGRTPTRRQAQRQAIDAILRQAYGEVVNEPVPDGFRAVLARSGPESATKS